MTEEEAPVKAIPVKVVGVKDGSALVEWDDGRLHRAYIPEKQIKDGVVAPAVLKRGIPYGLPWEQYVVPVPLAPEDIADQLRRRGIWDLEHLDVRALQRINQAFDLGQFIQKAKQEARK